MKNLHPKDRIEAHPPPPVDIELSDTYLSYGRVQYASGPLVRASGSFRIGDVCTISRKHKANVLAEVVGFSGNEAILTPYGDLAGVSSHSRIQFMPGGSEIPVGDRLLGRIIDSLGNPIDGKEPLEEGISYPYNASPPNPMSRPVIDSPISLGVKSIDALLTCGEGQRMGIFAAAGGGKSTLLSMLIRFTQADRCVIALIGERGREVREFVEHQLGDDGLKRATVVIATSDRPAIEQVKAAYAATSLAEYHRDQGHKVLLLMDSLTRFARAQRQIGLSAGEPPTRRGFPPSVFEKLPSLLERPGKSETGSITALYTVLVEGDDMNEPVADEVRSLLDGHIILSRKLAQKGHYPAIDVLQSVSRVFPAVTEKGHAAAAARFRELMSKYNDIEFLLRVGEYKAGQDPEIDLSIACKPLMDQLLQQDVNKHCDFSETLSLLESSIRGK